MVASAAGVHVVLSEDFSHFQVMPVMSPSGSASAASRDWSTLGVGAETVTHPASFRLTMVMVTLMEPS